MSLLNIFRHVPVLRRLLPSLKKRLAKTTWIGGFRVVTSRDVLWLLDYRNYVDRQIYLYGGYEDDRLDYLLSHMNKTPTDVFIDVGANFGLYTMNVAKSGNAARLIAYEPDPRNYDQLRANLYLNRLSLRAETYPCAVSDTPGTVHLNLFDDTSTGKTSVSDDASGFSVEAISLDHSLPLTNNRIFIKMDVEGHKLSSLKGMTTLLRENSCFIQVESFKETRAAVEQFMIDLDYKLIHSIEDDLYFSNLNN
jgi:FkbM family methyltransferase